MAGTRLLKEYDTRNRFFHFEFFRLDEDKDGLGRRHAISYMHSDEEVRRELSGQIIEDFEVDEVLAPDMGDHAFLLRADNKNEWQYQMNYVLERR